VEYFDCYKADIMEIFPCIDKLGSKHRRIAACGLVQPSASLDAKGCSFLMSLASLGRIIEKLKVSGLKLCAGEHGRD